MAPAGPPPAAAPKSPPWESAAAAPGAPPDAAAPDVPLAREEVDFIALAEEMVSTDEAEEGPAAPAPEKPEEPGSPAAPVPEQPLPPGAQATPEKVVLDGSLIGGYKGGFESSSAAGAGVQTAEDPFGLNITEKAPPTQAEEAGGRRRHKAVFSVIVMILALAVAGAVAYTGVYYGFLRKKTPSPGAPVAALKDYCEQVVSGDTSQLNRVSVPGATYAGELATITAPFEKLGVMTLKDFDATTTRISDNQATVQINKFGVEVMGTNGTEYHDLLAITIPNRLRTTVTLVRQGDEWKVTN